MIRLLGALCFTNDNLLHVGPLLRATPATRNSMKLHCLCCIGHSYSDCLTIKAAACVDFVSVENPIQTVSYSLIS